MKIFQRLKKQLFYFTIIVCLILTNFSCNKTISETIDSTKQEIVEPKLNKKYDAIYGTWKLIKANDVVSDVHLIINLDKETQQLTMTDKDGTTYYDIKGDDNIITSYTKEGEIENAIAIELLTENEVELIFYHDIPKDKVKIALSRLN